MPYQLAQLNIATLLAPLDSPQLADFVANLDRINTLAESSEGFVWRLIEDCRDPKLPHPFSDDVIVNISVWRDLEALKQFAFKSAHAEIMWRRREWFAKMASAYSVLWWIPAGHQPSLTESAERLAHLEKQGATEYAFTFAKPFDLN
ncbi:DUF3291 domain-containing protein [Thiofilum flexile]|uniref:DUF3291 domain-containing protein n=1 Tax=Thiofilum flexile TaxID=125627 RepID=UPI000379CC12|nr:DUF3291 domain-containing protein [Thiofilum flexile]